MRPCRPARPSASSRFPGRPVEEAATCAVADAGPGDGDGQMGLAGAGPPDEHHVALVGEELTAGEVVHQTAKHFGRIR